MKLECRWTYLNQLKSCSYCRTFDLTAAPETLNGTFPVEKTSLTTGHTKKSRPRYQGFGSALLRHCSTKTSRLFSLSPVGWTAASVSRWRTSIGTRLISIHTVLSRRKSHITPA